MEQLALVLKPDPTAFSDLDHLYTKILSVYPSAEKIVQFLGTMIAYDLPEVIEDIIEMKEGELKLMLRGLSSLIYDDENEERLDEEIRSYYSFAHASFGDYLFDSNRSREFHVNMKTRLLYGALHSLCSRFGLGGK